MRELEKLQYALPKVTTHTYQNPPIIHRPVDDNKEYPLVNPDPYVMKYNGCYYNYSTGATGVYVMKSENLYEWEHLGYALRIEEQKDYWAPAVFYYNGLFYMYYSSMGLQENDPHYEQMKIAVSEKPEGPFRYVKTLFDKFSIDAHVVRDYDGQFYLFYSTNDEAGVDADHPGTVILVDRLIDMYTVEGNPTLVVKPTIEEEVFEENRFGDGRDWHTIEGALYFTRRNKSYCMYSGNAYMKPQYFIGYSIADHDGQKRIIEKTWMKEPNEYTYAPLMKKNDHVLGTGHNSVAKAPNLVDDWIIYHGVDASRKDDMYTEEHRQLRIDPILWKQEKMWIPGPSSESQNIPAMSTARDLFKESLNSNLWYHQSGQWIVTNGELTQQSPSGKAELIFKQPISDYLCEVSVKWNKPVPSHLGGLYGLYLTYENEKNHVQLLFHVGRNQFQILSTINGIQSILTTGTLEKDFNWNCYHSILVEKLQSFVKISIDEREIVKLSIPFINGKFGFVTHYTSASYAGFSITKHISVKPENVQEFIKLVEEQTTTSSWSASESSLYFTKNKELGVLLLKEPFDSNYQFSVDIKTNSHVEGILGVYVAYQDEENYLKLIFNQQERDIEITQLENEKKVVTLTMDYPANLDFDKGHSLFVKVFNGKTVVMLDDYLVFNGAVNNNTSKIGFLTNMKSQFSHLQLTHLNL